MKEKVLSEKELGYKVSAENWRESYFKLMDKQAEAVKKLKEEYRLHGFKTKEFFEVIDKIMGNFYSPQDERARSRKVDSTSKNVRYNASKPISNKRGGSFEDSHVQKDKGCGNIIGKTKEGFRKFCGVHGLCRKCEEKK